MSGKKARYYFDNREKYIAIMTKWSWEKTSRYIDSFRQQMKWALQQKNDEAFEVLEEWESQVIEARMRKLDAEWKSAGNNPSKPAGKDDDRTADLWCGQGD